MRTFLPSRGQKFGRNSGAITPSEICESKTDFLQSAHAEHPAVPTSTRALDPAAGEAGSAPLDDHLEDREDRPPAESPNAAEARPSLQALSNGPPFESPGVRAADSLRMRCQEMRSCLPSNAKSATSPPTNSSACADTPRRGRQPYVALWGVAGPTGPLCSRGARPSQSLRIPAPSPGAEIPFSSRLEASANSRTIEELRGRGAVETTAISAHVLNRSREGLRSLADAL
jgi:hypothetical protein